MARTVRWRTLSGRSMRLLFKISACAAGNKESILSARVPTPCETAQRTFMVLEAFAKARSGMSAMRLCDKLSTANSRKWPMSLNTCVGNGWKQLPPRTPLAAWPYLFVQLVVAQVQQRQKRGALEPLSSNQFIAE